jgi:hypothetical protein
MIQKIGKAWISHSIIPLPPPGIYFDPKSITLTQNQNVPFKLYVYQQTYPLDLYLFYTGYYMKEINVGGYGVVHAYRKITITSDATLSGYLIGGIGAENVYLTASTIENWQVYVDRIAISLN